MARESGISIRTGPLVALVASGVLAACGGGGDSGLPGGGPAGNGGTSADGARSGLAVGTVSGFGSVIVDGVRYDTASASFEIDDRPGREGDLAVGHKVTVAGTLHPDGSTGVAERVSFEAEVEAPVTAIDVAAGSFVAAGQTVFVNNDTVYEDDIEPASLEGLTSGDFVEVSGFFDADGNLVATRIELEDDRDEIEVTGFVVALDTVAMTLTIGDLLVDYSAAAFDDLSRDELVVGRLIEVEGRSFGPDGALLATRLEDEQDDDYEDEGERDYATYAGLVTAFDSAESFAVDGRPVRTTAQTRFVNGSPEALREGLRVLVSGELDDAGVLVAARVKLKLPSNLKVEAPVESVDPASATFTVLGISIRVDAETRFKDDDREERRFGLEDLRTGDFVEVRGAPDPEGLALMLAGRVERDDDDDDDDLEDVELRGYVESVDLAARSLVILGVTVVGEDGDDDFDAVLARAMPGDLVEIEGDIIGDRLVEVDDDIEFEREEHNGDDRGEDRRDDGDDDDDEDDDDGGGDD